MKGEEDNQFYPVLRRGYAKSSFCSALLQVTNDHLLAQLHVNEPQFSSFLSYSIIAYCDACFRLIINSPSF